MLAGTSVDSPPTVVFIALDTTSAGGANVRAKPPKQLDFGPLAFSPPEDAGQLEQENRLEPTLEAAQEQVAEMLYERVSVHKMDYRRAWEESMELVLLPEE